MMLQTAKIFQNGMILQRGKEVCIWGKTEPGIPAIPFEVECQKEGVQ